MLMTCDGARAGGGRDTTDGTLGGPARFGALLGGGGGGDKTFLCCPMAPADDWGIPSPVMEGVATLLAGRLGMTGNAGGSYALGTIGWASAEGTC